MKGTRGDSSGWPKGVKKKTKERKSRPKRGRKGGVMNLDQKESEERQAI